MNKGELISQVAEKCDMTNKDAAKAINSVIESISDTLAKGGSVQLVGFGTFSVKQRAARTGRNPRTGEDIQIHAAKIPSFKAGSGLKDSVN